MEGIHCWFNSSGASHRLSK